MLFKIYQLLRTYLPIIVIAMLAATEVGAFVTNDEVLPDSVKDKNIFEQIVWVAVAAAVLFIVVVVAFGGGEMIGAVVSSLRDARRNNDWSSFFTTLALIVIVLVVIIFIAAYFIGKLTGGITITPTITVG